MKPITLTLALLLTACGGGSGGSPTPEAVPPPVESAAGIWRGSTCIVEEPLDIPGHEHHGRSEFACLFDGPTATGYVILSGGDVSGQGTMYDGSTTADGPVTGSLVGDQLTIAIEGHEFSLQYDPIFETGGVPLSELSGVYSTVTVEAWNRNKGAFATQTSGLTIDPDGGYFLQFGDCVLQGDLTKGEQNYYHANRSTGGAAESSPDCPIEGGTFSGLAFMDTTRLVIALFNSNGWLAFTAE